MGLLFNFRTFHQLGAFLKLAGFFVILCISVSMIGYLFFMTIQTKNLVEFESNQNQENSFTEIMKITQLLNHINSSASSLARALSSYMNGTELSFHEIETNVAPVLFLALSITSELSQISYIGADGLLFSYYIDQGQLIALFCNISHSSMWYTNPVNRDTGKLYGDAVLSSPTLTTNETWLQMAMNSSVSYSSISSKWHENPGYSNLLLLVTAPMDGRGLISLGYPLEIVTSHFAALDFHGGYFFLSTIHGHVIMPTMAKDTVISVDGGSVTVKLGGAMYPSDLICRSFTNDSKALIGTEIGSNKFYCSTLDVAGVSLVYVLQYPRKGFIEIVKRNNITMILLVLVLVLTLVPNCIFMFLTLRAIKREMFLCAALIKQLETTQQAERKSMNKTKAYARINHDIRNTLAVVTGFIDICEGDVKEGKISEVLTNLSQIKNCTEDLVGILNSVLNTSKVEAGKASLELEDFSLTQLLEDVMHMPYKSRMNKEVDMVLDPCDGSIFKLPPIRGDRLKLKQILCNLISNATKFTSYGHISVRAVVKRTNLKKEIIASNRTPTLKIFSWFYCSRKHRDEDTYSDLDAFHAVKENPNELEIEFEVDDTGRGIPKDKQLSIFEDYVQVKKTDVGQEGCGLGLGIVQSLVRIMKGELRIIEKEPGERGTCFRFNIFVSTCEPEDVDIEGNRFQHFQFMAPKPEGSHMVMCIHGEERRKVLKKYIENLSIKVIIINPERDVRSQLERLKRRLDFSLVKTTDSFDNSSPSPSSYIDLGSNNNNKNLISIKDGADLILPQYKTKNPSGVIIVFVIDSNVASSCYEFDRSISGFRNETQKFTCKFVWLEDQDQDLQRAKLMNIWYQEDDHLIHKPFHGSRLIQVLSLLPEFKGTSPPRDVFKSETGSTPQQQEADVEKMVQSGQVITDTEMPLKGKRVLVEDERILQFVTSKYPSATGSTTPQQEADVEKMVQSDQVITDTEMPMKGKKVLLVDDEIVLQFVTGKFLSKLGADIKICSNGEEAVHQVLSSLRDATSSKSLPYDYIFMDCEMPIMDGYKATKMIREGERKYGGVHIPIFALSAHTMPEDASKSIYAGMDFHLSKPLKIPQLLEVIRSIHKY